MIFPEIDLIETQSWINGVSLAKQVSRLRADRAFDQDFKKSPSRQIPQAAWTELRDCDRQVLALTLYGLTNDEIAQRVNLKNSAVVTTSVLRASKVLGIDKQKRDEVRVSIEKLSNPRQISDYKEVNKRDRLIAYFYDKAFLVGSDSKLISFSPRFIARLIERFVKELKAVDRKILKLELEKGLKHQEIAPLVKLDKSRVFSRATAFKKQVRESIDKYLSVKGWLPRQLDAIKVALLSNEDISILRAFLKDDKHSFIAKDHSIKERTVHNRLARIAKHLSLSREEFYEVKEHNLNKRDFNYLYANLLRFLFPPKGNLPTDLTKLGSFYDQKSLFKEVIAEIKNFNPRTNKRYFKLTLQGYSQGAISRKLSVSQSSISVSLARTRTRLLAFLNNKLIELK